MALSFPVMESGCAARGAGPERSYAYAAAAIGTVSLPRSRSLRGGPHDSNVAGGLCRVHRRAGHYERTSALNDTRLSVNVLAMMLSSPDVPRTGPRGTQLEAGDAERDIEPRLPLEAQGL